MVPQTSWFCPRAQQFWEKQALGPKPSQGPCAAPAQSRGGEGRRRTQLSCARGTQHHLSPCNARLKVGGERARKQHEGPRLALRVSNLRCVQPRVGRGRGKVAPDSARAQGSAPGRTPCTQASGSKNTTKSKGQTQEDRHKK